MSAFEIATSEFECTREEVFAETERLIGVVE